MISYKEIKGLVNPDKSQQYNLSGDKLYYKNIPVAGILENIFGDTIYLQEFDNLSDFYRIRDKIINIGTAAVTDDDEAVVIKDLYPRQVFICKDKGGRTFLCPYQGLNYYRGARGYANRKPKISARPCVGDEIILFGEGMHKNPKGYRCDLWEYKDMSAQIKTWVD